MPGTLTPAAWRQLQEINDRVNQGIRYAPDQGEDRWDIVEGGGTGDCEDYALTKRAALIALGWPGEALRIATAWTPSGVYHAVLTVDTDRGTYVLDNRYPRVEPWEALPYRWHRRSPARGALWAEITATGALPTAAR
jgi:predicted transglutaminase-like cysteine proteinase